MPSFRVRGHAAVSSTPNHASRPSQGRTPSGQAFDGSDLRKVGRSYSIHSATTSRKPSLPVPPHPTPLRPAKEAHNPAASYHCIGLMMPVYLAPLIYHATRESLCLFSVLLPLCWWLTTSIPRCVAAFAPVLTLPALQLMSPDETAAHFFESDSLEVVAFLALVTASHSSSGSLLRRLSYRFCSKYGLQVPALYLSLSCTTYVLAIFVNKSVLAVLFVVAVDKVLSCVHESDLDKTPIEDHVLQHGGNASKITGEGDDCDDDGDDYYQLMKEPLNKLSPLRRKSRSFVPGATNRPDTEKLFARLAQAVDYLSDDTAEAVTLKRRKTRVIGEAQPRKEQQLKQETWELDPAGAPGQLNAFVSSAKPDEDAANSARIRKRFVEKLVRRSSAPTPSKPAEVTNAISALGRKISSKRDQAAPTTLDATVADVSRRKEHSALLDLFPSRDSRRSAQKLRRGAQNETATEKRSGSGTTVPFTAIAPGASPAHPAAPPANKDGPKVPCDFLVERDEGAHAVVLKAEAPLVTVHSVSKRPKEREAHPSKTQSANGQKFPDKRKKSSIASSTAMDPQPAGSREGSTVKRRTTRSGSRRRKERAQGDLPLAAALNEGAAPLLEAPASVTAAAPEGEVPAKEKLPSATLPIDIRRPSILKLPRHFGTAVQSSTDVRGRRSIVDFGLLTPKGLVEGEPPKTSLFADGATDGAPSEAGGAKPSSSITPAARKRRFSLGPRRFSSTSLVTASPCAPFMSASMTDSAFHGSDPMAQRKKPHKSMRTACLLTCSLVAVSASASSMVTGAAKDALASNFIVKKNFGGLVAWLVLVTPASILCAMSCCAWLYFLHLSGRKAQSLAEMNEVCVTAATRLSKMGPINTSDLLIAYGLVVYVGFTAIGAVLGYNASKNMLSFLSFLLVASSALPATIQRFWDEESRMLVWASVSRDMPWAVVIMNSTVQLATHVVENNNLVESGLDSLGVDFWTHNSPLANQLLLGAIGSVLAEVMDNKVLNFDLMPFVVKVGFEEGAGTLSRLLTKNIAKRISQAEMTAVEPWVYAVPAALGACTNMILPIHLPMIVIHEVVDVSMLQLVLVAVVAKTIIVLTSVFATNTYGGYILDWAAPQLNTTEPFE